MSNKKFLCMYRGAPAQGQASPAQMQEMFAAYGAWMEKFKANFADAGDKLKSGGRIVTPDMPRPTRKEVARYCAGVLTYENRNSPVAWRQMPITNRTRMG